MEIRELVIQRSGGRCEAMVKLPRAWTRCGRGGVEDHHLLTRARGGGVLDEVGETYHHLALCPRHHRMVDDMGFDSGLLIAGYAWRDGERVVYQGPDPYLSQAYPGLREQPGLSEPVPVPVLRGELRDPGPDDDARGEM